MERFAKFVQAYRWLFIVALILPSLFFIKNAANVETNNSIEIWLEQNDPALAFYEVFKNDFGNDEFLLVAIDDDNIFTPTGIKKVSKVASDILALDRISEVISLADTFKEKISSPYFKELLRRAKSANLENKDSKKSGIIDIFKQEMLNDPLYVNSVISKDGKTTAILARVKEIAASGKEGGKPQNPTEYRKRLIANVRGVIAKRCNSEEAADQPEKEAWFMEFVSRFIPIKEPTPLPLGVHLAGPSVVNAELDRMSQRDLSMFIPLMFMIALVALVLLFKKAPGVIIPMTAIGLCNLWTLGLFASFGNTMNMISGIITPVIFIIALANSIHLINHYYLETDQLIARPLRITTVIKNIGAPCLFTCLTTALGFLSLTLSDVAPVKTTGGFIAAGIMMSFFILTVLIILAFSFFRGKERVATIKKRDNQIGVAKKQADIFMRFLSATSKFVCKKPRNIIIFSAGLTVVSICGLLLLNVESDLLKAFPEQSAITRSNKHIEQKLAGLLPMDVVVSPRNSGESLIKLETLNRIDAFQEFLIGMDDIGAVVSVVDFIKKVNLILNKGEVEYFCLPKSDEKAQTELNMASLHGGKIVDGFYNEEKNSGRISIRMKQLGSKKYSEIVNRIKEYINANISSHLKAEVTGVVHLLIKMQDYLLMSQIKTFSLAFVVIFLVIAFLLRSVKLALVGMIPNIIPIIIIIGVMGYSGIGLDSGTVMIASVAIGIAVDDTIHFLYRFKKELKRIAIAGQYQTPTRADYEKAIESTISGVGRAIIFTSIVAFCGFMVICLSSFKPIQHFGLLTAITMASALVADLFILPAAILIIQPEVKFREHVK